MKKHQDIFRVSSRVDLTDSPRKRMQLLGFVLGASTIPLLAAWSLNRLEFTIPLKVVGFSIGALILILTLVVTLPFIRTIRADLAKSLEMRTHVSWGVLHQQNPHGVASRGTLGAIFLPLLVAIIASTTLLLNGQLKASLTLTFAFLFFVFLVLISRVSRWIFKKVPLLEFVMLGVVVSGVCALNLWAANTYSWAMAQDSFLRTMFGLTFAIVSYPIQFFLSSMILRGFLGPLILKLPIRKSYATKRLPVFNLIGFIEYLLVRQFDMLSASSVAFAVLTYWLFQITGSPIIFIFISISIYLPIISASMLHGQIVSAAELRYVRRITMQTSAISIISFNILLPLAYTVGWLILQSYVWFFGSVGNFPIPEIFYAFREQTPLQLPLMEQAEAAFISVCALLAASWLLFILQTRSWRELIYLGASLALAVVVPYLSLPEDFIDQNLPITREVPAVIIGLILPAVRGFFVREIQEGFVTPSSGLTCNRCGQADLAVDARFCSACGSEIEPQS